VDLSRPFAPVRSPTDLEVLRVLGGTTRPLTGRDVARLVRSASQPTVNASLRRLTEEGLVLAEQAGNAYLHTLNRRHLAAPAVALLADLRGELERRLRAEIAGWDPAPAHVSVFGSAARGDGDTASDIDLFVVRPARVAADDPQWRTQLAQLGEDVFGWTGNHAGIAEVSASDVRRLRRERPPIVAELERDSVTLAGPQPRELLRSRP
jgi:DNA-binding transcriptional ArsR family regulator